MGGGEAGSGRSTACVALSEGSFCGKPQNEVAKLIAGLGVYVCDECSGVVGQ